MIRRAAALLQTTMLCALLSGGRISHAQRQSWIAGPIGVNLAGADMPVRQGVTGEAYIAPVGQEFRYYRSKHIRLFRIPFYWERAQKQLNGPLDTEELRRLDAIVSEAHALHVRVIIDVHSYDRWQGRVLGTDPNLERAFADLWRKLAEHFASQDNIFAYGLMNEPHDTGHTWPRTAQIAIDAIRSVDRRHTIIIPGDQWSNTRSWPEANPDLLSVHDSANNVLYEGHVYFDADNSGTYKHSYDEDRVDQNVGLERVKPFVAWLQTHHVRGIVTEVGSPGNDPRWNSVLANTLTYLHTNHITAVYWAGGPLWRHYALSVEPVQGRDAPQMTVLERQAMRQRWWQIF